jgi:hypothetical protein
MRKELSIMQEIDDKLVIEEDEGNIPQEDT